MEHKSEMEWDLKEYRNRFVKGSNFLRNYNDAFYFHIRVVPDPELLDYNVRRSWIEDGPDAYSQYENYRVVRPHNTKELAPYDLAETWYMLPFVDPNKSSAEEIHLEDFRDYAEKRFFSDVGHDIYTLVRQFSPKALKHFLDLYLRCALCKTPSFGWMVFSAISKHVYGYYHYQCDDLLCYLWKSLCETSSMYTTLTTRNIQPHHLDLVFRACSRSRFDFRRYMIESLDRDENGGQLRCPVIQLFYGVRVCMFKVFLQHGFQIDGDDVGKRLLIAREEFIRISKGRKIEPYFERLLDFASRWRFPMLEIFLACFAHTIDSYEELMMMPVWLYRSIPDTIISMNEFGRFIYEAPAPYTVKGPMFEIFARFPYIRTGISNPRSLKHLARCVVRRMLRDNFFLPEGIDRLGLVDTKLIHYLHLES